MDKTQAIELRLKIKELLDAGVSISSISEQLGCSRTTIYKVQKDPDTIAIDKREQNVGRPRLYEEIIREKIVKAREMVPTAGPRILFHLMRRDPEKFGVEVDDLPSPGLIANILRDRGMVNKPIGPKDKRVYPERKPTAPGSIAIDTWGPWHIKAERVYLCTVQDRFTRLAGAIPAINVAYPQEGTEFGNQSASWARAIMLAHEYLTKQEIYQILADNGVGVAPQFGILPLAVRVAFSLGAKVTFIPPAQPWRNGRLENFHWVMEREFWRLYRPTSPENAYAKLTDFLNYYNYQRPHTEFRYKAPAEENDCARPFDTKYWTKLVPPKKMERQSGVVEAIRVVYNSGTIDLWGQPLKITPLLAGQYVRVVFNVDKASEISDGIVLYQQMKKQDVPVARFTHALDSHWGQNNLIRTVEPIDFAVEDVPTDEGLNEEQLANQMSRTMKRRSNLEKHRAGES